ncbi:hypothetical protein FACS1894187_02630 [Synergistales bacterium]|nr:hypothetical protein FACS1894187_02630 [Synergistales bacterium]
MIGKPAKSRTDKRSSFRTLINYIVGERNEETGESERAIHIGTRNLFCDIKENYKAIASELSGLGSSNTRIKDPIFHFILSYRPTEIPTIEQTEEAVDIALRELGLQNCKTIFGVQNDTGIHHIHVCTCKVDPDTGKAIDPGKGWPLETLMKASREIELKQGWEILEQDPYWEVKNGRVVKKPKQEKTKQTPALKTGARDFEAHTGEKSSQTTAIEQVADIIRKSKTWDELHSNLSYSGFKYQRKGSGAVILVNGIWIKASDAGRDCSIANLEKRIGQYKNIEGENTPGDNNSAEKQTLAQVKTANTEKTRKEPTKQVSSTKKGLNAWQRYQIYKDTYQKKKLKRKEFFAVQKLETQELKLRQKLERSELFKHSWKGKGKALNARRMEMAAHQLQERILLRRKQAKEKEEMLPPFEKFLSYRRWLKENEPERVRDIRNWQDATAEKVIRENVEAPQIELAVQEAAKKAKRELEHKEADEATEKEILRLRAVYAEKKAQEKTNLKPETQNINALLNEYGLPDFTDDQGSALTPLDIKYAIPSKILETAENPVLIAKSILGPSVSIIDPQPNTTYTGDIARIGREYAIQKTAPNKCVIHDLSRMTVEDYLTLTDMPKNNRHVSISYNNNDVLLEVPNKNKEQKPAITR